MIYQAIQKNLVILTALLILWNNKTRSYRKQLIRYLHLLQLMLK